MLKNIILLVLVVTEITPKGARFNAEIIYRGDEEILNYGFVWRTFRNPSLGRDESRIITANLKTNAFSELIETTLTLGGNYHVRAFVRTKEFTVYGEEVTFSSQGSQAPELLNFSPTSGLFGDTIVIQGKGFSSVLGNANLVGGNVVTFGGVPAKVVVATDSLLKALVPFELEDESVQIKITVAGYSARSNDNFILLKPTIIGFSQNEFQYCDSLRIIGANFPFSKKIFVNFLDQVTEARVINQNELITLVPQYLKGRGSIVPNIVFGNFTTVTEQEIKFRDPEVTFIVDSSLSYNDTFQIQLANLTKCKIEIQVQRETPTIISQEGNKIIVKVPEDVQIRRDQKITVKALLNDELLAEQNFYRQVVNYRITPSSAKLGDVVKLEGRGYRPGIFSNGIDLWMRESCNNTGCRIKCEVIEASDRHILFKLPEGIENLINDDGKVYISVYDFSLDIPLFEYKIEV